MNFPLGHQEPQIRKICEVFGKVINIELLPDSNTGYFSGNVNVDFGSEIDAKRAQSSMMGFKIEDCVLDVKRVAPSEVQTNAADGEMFKQLIEDKPTCCLCLKNIVLQSEIESRIDYKELEFDVEDEMIRYGKVVRVVVPRPPVFGDPFSMAGYGRVYVRFRELEEARRARDMLSKRMFNGRVVDVQFYPEDRFIKGVWG